MTFKVTHSQSMKILGYIEWDRDKSLNTLLGLLEKKGFIEDSKKYLVMVESYGLCFSILEKFRSVEFLYVSLCVEAPSDVMQ